jgi:hypothetical protein
MVRDGGELLGKALRDYHISVIYLRGTACLGQTRLPLPSCYLPFAYRHKLTWLSLTFNPTQHLWKQVPLTTLLMAL